MAKVNLDLDFDGKTRLKDWWEPNVKDNFQTVQNTLNGNIDTENIADGAVTTAKIANSAVKTDKINGSAVTTAKIASSAVTTAKIADANVTYAKLASDVTSVLDALDKDITGVGDGLDLLRERISDEEATRENADDALRASIYAEAEARESADDALFERITAPEITQLSSSDDINNLSDGIYYVASNTANAPVTGTGTLIQRTPSGGIRYQIFKHDNGEIYKREYYNTGWSEWVPLVSTGTIADGAVTTAKIADANVTYVKLASDVTSVFDGLRSDINAEAAARESADNDLLSKINATTGGGADSAYILRLILAERAKTNEQYAMLGYTVVDGGLYGMREPAEAIDGNFEGEPPLIIDCGGFEPRSIKADLENSAGKVDGGEY